MNLLRKFAVALLFSFFVLVFTSARPAAYSEPAGQSLVQAPPKTSYSYRELKKMAEEQKGGKLSLKEQILLKAFRKKFSDAAAAPYAGGKSQLTAVLLCFFLGGLGIHRFYLGYTWQGIVQLLTLGGLGIWALIDFIRILTGDLQPKDGEYEKTL